MLKKTKRAARGVVRPFKETRETSYSQERQPDLAPILAVVLTEESDFRSAVVE